VLAQVQQAMEEKTIAHLKKFRSDYSKSMLEKKPELISRYYSENVRLMPEFQKTVIGEANALSYHQAFLTRFDILEYSRTEVEALALGSRVVEVGMFTMQLLSKTSGREHEVKGKYQNIWERLSNGDVLLIAEAWNYNHQLEIEDKLRFTEVPAVDVSHQAHLPINSPISFELAALNRLMEITITQHDAKIWSQFYTDDASFLYSRNPIHTGRKAVDRFLEDHVKELPVFEKLDIRNDRIDDLGNYVIEYASHIAIIRNGNFSGVFTGKDIRIWRREPGGSLKIFKAMAMYD
jgi:ketosteroid isomerase-like protein